MQLLTSALVRPLDDSFQAVLDGVGRARHWPTSSDVARLGALVEQLSAAYNGPAAAPLRTPEALAARLAFSFPRDVPKGAGAVRELVATGALTIPSGRPLRILDVGAGLGATSRGVVRALAAAGASGSVVIDATDADAAALDVAAAIAKSRPREGDITLELRTTRGLAAANASARGSYDVVLLGQVLSELDRAAPDLGADGRVARHVALLRGYADALKPAGSLVVVEPALRERTRHLHALRDALLAGNGTAKAPLRVFAPCLHDAPCPMLPREGSWCHEDLDVDLPPWLVPVARAAGLRWQGLTFSYLVLRRDESRQAPPSSVTRQLLRVVSSPVVTKGKRELFLCGVSAAASSASNLRGTRLDRQAAPANAPWDEAARGDVLAFTPPLDPARPRVLPETVVHRLTAEPASPPAVDRGSPSR